MNNHFWQPAYVALGSNLEQPAQQIKRALAALEHIPQTRGVLHSSLYSSVPMGRQDQPAFINVVTALLTRLDPAELLSELHKIESHMGRMRIERWGPRIIDLDLLLCGDARSDVPQLQLPHPGLMQRNFVLIPLAEIAPDLLLPGGGTAQQWATRLGDAGLERLP